MCFLVSDYLLIVLPGGNCHYEAVNQLEVPILQLALQHHTLLMTSVRIFSEIVI